MAALDWICLGVLVASMTLGAWRGLLFEVLSLVAWVAAFFIARAAAASLGALLPMGDTAAGLRWAAGFALVFIATVFAGGLLASLARRASRSLGVRSVDRAFGAGFGLARGVLLLLVATLVVQLAALGGAPWWRNSVSGPWLDNALVLVRPLLPDALGSRRA